MSEPIDTDHLRSSAKMLKGEGWIAAPGLMARAAEEIDRLRAEIAGFRKFANRTVAKLEAVRAVLDDVTEPEDHHFADMRDLNDFDHGVDVTKNLIHRALDD